MSVSNNDIKTGDTVLINWNEFNKKAPYYLNTQQLQILGDLEKNDCSFRVSGLALGHAYISINLKLPDYVDVMNMKLLLPRSFLHKIY